MIRYFYCRNAREAQFIKTASRKKFARLKSCAVVGVTARKKAWTLTASIAMSSAMLTMLLSLALKEFAVNGNVSILIIRMLLLKVISQILVCTFTCSKNSGLLIHMQVHTLEKAIACPNCGFGYANNTKFLDHCVRQVKGIFTWLSCTMYSC